MLTTFSYITGFFRIGCVIMLLHDLADIFLQVSLRPGEFQLIILGLKILSLNLNKKLKSQYYEL